MTLTYDDEHLPESRSLVRRDFVLFMKRLRKHAGPGIKFFQCGEYGDQTSRPHYHACLFGVDFHEDRQVFKTDRGNTTYTSETLNRLWPLGYAIIGDVTFESAAYVARYVMKKRTGPKADEHYNGREPEYATMSRGGRSGRGLASEWFEAFKRDIYPHDHLWVNGKKTRPPRYYDKLLEIEDPKEIQRLKEQRKQNAKKHSANNTRERRATREKIANQKIKQLKRTDT